MASIEQTKFEMFLEECKRNGTLQPARFFIIEENDKPLLPSIGLGNSRDNVKRQTISKAYEQLKPATRSAAQWLSSCLLYNQNTHGN